MKTSGGAPRLSPIPKRAKMRESAVKQSQNEKREIYNDCVCPFLGFTLEVEREGGVVWLSLTGRHAAKPFIMAEIGDHLPVNIQR